MMRLSLANGHVSAHHAMLRRVAANLAAGILPYTVDDANRGLPDAEDFLEAGYGLLVVINHFSLRDAPQALALLCRSPVMRRRRIVTPVALHQYRRYSRSVDAFCSLLAIDNCPIVTPHTGSPHPCARETRRTLKHYIAEATSVLQAGGIVLLAPQGRRCSRLGTPRGRPVAQLLRRLPTGSSGHGTALMLVGLTIPGETDYASMRARGLNLGRRYKTRIGATVTAKQAVKEATHLRHVDAWVFERLRLLLLEQ